MLQPGYSSFRDRPRAIFLRRAGGFLLVAGVALNVSMLLGGHDINLRLALLILSPSLILLFSAFLAENTPSMRGCLTFFALLLAFTAAFWAWVGVTVALSPEDEPPGIFQELPAEDAAEPTEAEADERGGEAAPETSETEPSTEEE
ncbi:MAG: hypothetical protein ACOX9R_11600 [Armatimonadota bacterium]|jgi:hypothetical protein